MYYLYNIIKNKYISCDSSAYVLFNKIGVKIGEPQKISTNDKKYIYKNRFVVTRDKNIKITKEDKLKLVFDIIKVQLSSLEPYELDLIYEQAQVYGLLKKDVDNYIVENTEMPYKLDNPDIKMIAKLEKLCNLYKGNPKQLIESVMGEFGCNYKGLSKRTGQSVKYLQTSMNVNEVLYKIAKALYIPYDYLKEEK
jgi:hypothetical protein